MSEPRYPDIEGERLATQVAELKNYIIELQRYFRHGLHNLDAKNMTRSFANTLNAYLDEDGVMQVIDSINFNERVDFSGLVRFIDLSTKGNTVINGGNITTGTINAELVRAYKEYVNYVLSATFKDESIVFRVNEDVVGSMKAFVEDGTRRLDIGGENVSISPENGGILWLGDPAAALTLMRGDRVSINSNNIVSILGNRIDLDGSVFIDGENINDFPTSTWKENGWSCRCWKSGRAECFGRFSFNVSFTASSGALYTQAAPLSLPEYPEGVTFLNPPVALIMPNDDAGAWAATTAKGTATSPPKFKLLRTNSTGGTQDVDVDVYVSGSRYQNI